MTGISDPFKLIGSKIADKYTVEAVIDRGGYGLVYRAFHELLRVPVALKFFTGLAQAAPDKRDELLERFAQEGALLTSLSTRSASIVQARDIGTVTTEDGTWLPYLVLEWLEGASLETLLHGRQSASRGRKYGWVESFYLLDGVARALAVAHAAGVAHRDIKPGNFFVVGGELKPGTTVKLLDFGIAKVMPENVGMTKGQASEFTPKYGAPEQFDRQHGATGPWTDVFGFALVLLELVRGGQRVFAEREFMALATACQDPLRRPTPRTLGLEVSDAVEEVFAQALTVKVHERFEHMAAFWNALGNALEIRDYQAVVSDGRNVGLAVGEARAAASLRERVVDASLRAPSASGSGGRALRELPPSLSMSEMSPDVTPRGGIAADGAVYTRVAPAPAPVRPQGRRLGLIFGGVLVGLAGVAVVVASLAGGRGEVADAEPPVVAAPAEPAVVTPPPAEVPPQRCAEGMAFIPGGKFFMGSDSVDSEALMRSSRPAHQVEVADFCMDLREVTAGEHAACSTDGECKRAFRDAFWPQGKTDKRAWEASRAAYSPLCNEGVAERSQHPINCVTWEQADSFCRKRGKRLPSEAEWEFAARGSDGRLYPWGDEPPGPRQLNGCGRECLAWRASAGLDPVPALYDVDDGFPGTAPVGSFPAGKTQAGLLDMVGNVFEWTADDFEPYPGAPAGTMQAPAGSKVMRGGAFNSSQAEHAEPALRFPQDATAHVHAVGFRCASAPRSTP